MSIRTQLPPRPLDATLSVTRAAQVLGVHPNTIRAWSEAGRLRYYRINPRGDRRYRLGDLQRFLNSAVSDASPGPAPAQVRRQVRGGAETVLRVAPVPRIISAPRPGSREKAALALVATLGRLAASALRDAIHDPEAVLGSATRAIRERGGFRQVVVWRHGDTGFGPVGVSGVSSGLVAARSRDAGVLADAMTADRLVRSPETGELAHRIVADGRAWGVLTVVDGGGSDDPDAADLIAVCASAIGTIVEASAVAADVSHRLHRADALRRVGADIGSRLDLEQILAGVVDHVAVLFGGDRAGVFLVDPDDSRRVVASRGLSAAYLAAVRQPSMLSLTSAAISNRRPMFAVGYRDDPRAADLRAAIVQEGYDTMCVAPLFDGDAPEPLGVLTVYHDRPHAWSEDELETIGALATQTSVAIKAAANYAQLATWAAQLQSLQQLGTRLSRLSSVREIGETIATELRELIDTHNVRVYRLVGEELLPVAMRGQVGLYVDETPEMLRVKVGEGITGWVAEHGIAQILHDAAADPRVTTIPGTEDDLDESMLLAPMIFEDQVLGVIVLSKLGLHQFSDDDLRVLVIYASFAAQAMSNAEATGRLHEQSAALERTVRGQRELLRLTESMLATRDVRAVLETVVDRLGGLVGWDNIAIELVDPARGILTPVIAKGRDADYYMLPWAPGETGLATWVVAHNEAVLIADQFDDPRVAPLPSGPVHGSLVCVPLRDRNGAIGVLTLERVGPERSFGDEEFELVQLFAAQVSVALQNAQVFGAVERQAQTDGLTGLLNHGTFRSRLAAAVTGGLPFGLVMLDLDGFKRVNDLMGHQAGDVLLAEIGAAIVGASRDSDAVFRYGGDEFSVLMPGADASSVEVVAERIRSAVADVVGPRSRWRRAEVGSSVGVSSFPTDGATADEVLLAADRACFIAKRSGGGRVATAAEGQALVGEFSLQSPTPIDPTPTDGS